MDVGEVQREAGIPTPPALGVIAVKVGHIFDGRAETGGTDHRAIGTAQAAGRHVIPPRMLLIALQKLLDAEGIHCPAHLPPGPRDGLACGLMVPS